MALKKERNESGAASSSKGGGAAKAGGSGSDRSGRSDGIATNGNFVTEALRELEKVTFPTRQETIQATIVTVLIVVFIAMSVFLVDLVFDGMMSAIVRQG